MTAQGAQHQRSARTYVGGEGHLSLPDARRRALEEVEKAETVWMARREAEQQAFQARRAAIITHDRATTARNDAAEKLERAKEHLMYVMGQTDG